MKDSFQSDTVTPVPPRQVERDYLHTVQAGAWLPFLQATITGGIIGFCTFGLFFVFDIRHPEMPGLIAGLLAWAVTWLLLQRHWFALTALERITGRDLDGDGVIGRDEPQEVRVRVSSIKENGHFQENIYPLPGSYEQLRELASGLIERGEPFACRIWAGRGRPFSDSQFAHLRSEMIRRGLLEQASPKDARQGYVLTAKGEQVFRGILENSPSPTDSV